MQSVIDEIDEKVNIVLLYNDKVLDVLISYFSNDNEELLLNYEIDE